MNINERITREELHMKMALLVAERATCGRRKVGCIITKESRIISTGYNGPLKGDNHCSKETCNLESNCIRSVHAEANAISFAAKEGISLAGSTLCCTSSPCKKCAELIIQSGIVKVVYLHEYSGWKDAKDFLNTHGVTLIDICQVD
jgi:dCMP deaminase